MDIYISEAVRKKLKEKHSVCEEEVLQCFRLRKSKYAYDTRSQQTTYPPTLWFISETASGRRLKIVCLRFTKTEIVLKTAYEPSADEELLYHLYEIRG
jgi:hypothetical protein